MCFELDADTEIETRDYGAMTVAELERLMRARGARANAPATLRCSGSFHDPTRVRTDSPPHQLGPLRPRHLRHHDGNDLAPARAGAVRACSNFWVNYEKEGMPMD